MTRLERLKQQETQTRLAMHKAMRDMELGVLSKLQRKLNGIQEQIKEAEEYAVKKLTEQLPAEKLLSEHIPELVGEVHMIMDALIDATMDLRLKLAKFGLDERTITGKVKAVEDLLNDFLADACKASPFVEDFIVDNAEIVDSVRDLVHEYVSERFERRKAERAAQQAKCDA